MKKICLIEVWFGPFPPWHDFYLKTCELNPRVDWLIFHDAPRPARAPTNIRFVPLTKSELERRASVVLGDEILLPSGFKVCDLRPAFGAVFSDWLSGFDFWGYNDSDLFWGDITRFVTDQVLDCYDVVTSCRASVVGQFTLFRNTGVTRFFHQLIPNYTQIVKQPGPGYLDEGSVDTTAVSNHLRIYRRQLQVHDLNAPEWEAKARAMELAEAGNLNDWFWEEGPCHWDNGRLVHCRTGREAMFVHFKTWKSRWRANASVPRGLPFSDRLLVGFSISEKGLHPRFKPAMLPLAPFYLLRYFGWNRIRHGASRLNEFQQRLVRGFRRRLGAP